jgi:PIN domain nuclease of toxin-antitoxin system
VILLDAFAIESLFADEPAADEVQALLESGEQSIINAVNFAEVVDRLVRIRGIDSAQVLADLDEVGCTVSGLDKDLAIEAALLRARHYHRTHRSVSIADCCAAAHALDRDAQLATADPDLLDLMVDEGGRVLVLPQSNGSCHNPYVRRPLPDGS